LFKHKRKEEFFEKGGGKWKEGLTLGASKTTDRTVNSRSLGEISVNPVVIFAKID